MGSFFSGKRQDSYDLIVVQPPAWGIDSPPMTLAYISKHLRQKGFLTRSFDLNISEYNRAKDKGYWENEKTYMWMREQDFSVLESELEFDFRKIAQIMTKEKTRAYGFSVSASTKIYAAKLITELKRVSKAKIILGGKGVFLDEDRVRFHNLADFFVIGEGEDTILELMRGIRSGKNKDELSKIKGLISPIHPSRYVPRPLMDMKSKDAPDYKEFHLDRYTGKSIGMILSQGCIGTCRFCEDKIFQGHYRTRDPDTVAQEMIGHHMRYGIRKFWFHDLAINGDYKVLDRLCCLLILAKLDIEWIALAIARKDFPRGLLFKMKQAGCHTLNFGIESGSDSMLKKMDKYKLFSSADAARVIKDAKEAGINTQLNFIVGYPGETEQEFLETLDFIKSNRENICGITNINTCVIPTLSPLAKLPGYELISEAGVPPEVNWKDDALDLEKRRDRAMKAYEHVKELGFDVWFSNLCETKR